ncbi:MAG: zinc dependent phospholipase C family protein [Sulfurimonas sp.]|jgi:hypothetical protein|uniref:zinc dependent phospholipase C family protein n=1 Tax=Sulfurimonas sp. TaxID=2022749 RepID=UPI003569529B
MPGAFAHLTLVNLAAGDNKLDQAELNVSSKIAISENIPYIELGAVSPDYPYLAISILEDNAKWADYMHLDNKTDVLIDTGIKYLQSLDGTEKDKAFAWLCGLVSHIVADVVIHPVVELKVGPYHGNEKAHRICEMHQDAHIYKRMELGAIGLSEHLSTGIGKCSFDSDKDKIDPLIKDIWMKMLRAIRPNEFNEDVPNIDAWHEAFNKNVGLFEEGHKLHPLARHVAVNAGMTYPDEDNIDIQYIENLTVPNGTMNYDDIADIAVDKIVQAWKRIGDAVYMDDSSLLTHFGGWNLDSGRDTNNQLVYWA